MQITTFSASDWISKGCVIFQFENSAFIVLVGIQRGGG